MGNLSLSLLILVLLLVFMELAVRGYQAVSNPDSGTGEGQVQPVPKHIVTGTPVMYGLNPAHHQVNSQGLRDDEVELPKPAGRFRILVLGDSIAYGSNVSRDQTFPNRLETLLRETVGPVDVINAGVSGYTAYNELQYYLAEGREFDADIVMVAFCMNDIVNPRLHWGYTKDAIGDIPDEAIPNHEYDRNHALPKLLKLREQQQESLADYSRLLGLLGPRVRSLFAANDQGGGRTQAGVPVYITGDDSIGIDVLLDRQSPEWRWLEGIYDQLHAAVTADNARLVIGIFPLAYQLDEGYPYFPQEQIMEYCTQRAIPCLDFLDPFRQYPKQRLFRLASAPVYDVWHLTGFGHEFSAHAILDFLGDQELLPAAPK